MLEIEGLGYINQHLITRIYIEEEFRNDYTIVIRLCDGQKLTYKTFTSKELAEEELKKLVSKIELHQINDWLRVINKNICTIGESVLNIESKL